jgi:hypothetical protein
MVCVEKYMYCVGTVFVEAESAEQAMELVDKQIATGKLQTTMVDWGTPEYEDGTFNTVGLPEPD